MGTRTGSHQLSSGLMVSGRPDHHLKERQPIMASRSVIYTGGDVKNSGDLGKMCGINASIDPPKVPSACKPDLLDPAPIPAHWVRNPRTQDP
ncbi:UNVERIFIED_CONTAM: putative membrane protein [Sesamum angustifolium]|uniref:Membrane protein n=1 Tax=Sesamum angustifolium TaxID=2727405 RepID=A0AAW2KW68_9LAMI